MDPQYILLFLSVWIGNCVSTEEDRTFSVTIDTVKINEDHSISTAAPDHIKVKEENQEDIDKDDADKFRTSPRNLNNNFKGCCGVKTSIRSAESIVRNGDYDGRINTDRVYTARYGPTRPEERYGWQNVNPPNKVQGIPDRYNQRPTNADNQYSGTSRPATTYGVNYGDNRPHGSAIYTTKPAYGLAGTLGEPGEFGPDHGYQEVAPPLPTGINIQTQKAVALKALAGVALIGAAAALATNPALMPLGVISGRRKRSEPMLLKNSKSNYPLKIFDDFISQVKEESGEQNLPMTPNCVARLACEVQRDYMTDLKQNEEILNKDKDVLQGLEIWFINLIRRNVLDVDYVSTRLKKLIKLAISVGSENRDCRVFSCDLMKNQ